MSEPIIQFRGANNFLSNFFPCNVRFEDATYPSSEHAFQAAKTLDKDERTMVQLCPSPAKAKSAGRRRITLRDNWDNIKDGIMLEIVRAKFAQNERLLRKLLVTGDAELKEGNTWNDTYWGVNKETGVGQNKLGKILMQVREELR